MPLCGLVIESFGWDAAFYVTGALSLVSCLTWFAFMYETPGKHPRICPKELDYIQEKVKTPEGLDTPPSSIPWKEMVTTDMVLDRELLSVITIRRIFSAVVDIYAHCLVIGGYLCLLSCYRFMGKISINSGDMSMPFYFQPLNLTFTLNILLPAAMFGPALNLLAVAYSGCDPTVAVFLLCLGFLLNGFITTGLFANKTDITTNFVGTVCGIGNTCANMASVIVPIIVGALTLNQKWNYEDTDKKRGSPEAEAFLDDALTFIPKEKSSEA
ncbi:inorganic phosphate cotransporter-like 4 [Homarus americanus]|uniref:Inorganic phosphate cotransporter-like 4 n=1 Tax=Homarus americanus TaxID=6706 RepID=A0A8J5MME3_HOMAM|nr:inorganic phosphate cotransporter-like 4 [Homarus americanus]